jgi:hypothetical protein
MRGICCECQSIHDVKKVYGTFEYEDDSGESRVMQDHELPGTTLYCKGSGTYPQAIIKGA